MNGWAKIKAAAKYAGVSERTLRTWLKQGLKHSRLPTGTVLVSYDDIDNYLKKYVHIENRVDRIVDNVLADWKKPKDSHW